MPPAFAYTHRTATPTEDLREKASFCELMGDVQIVLCAVWCVTFPVRWVMLRSKKRKNHGNGGGFSALKDCVITEIQPYNRI